MRRVADFVDIAGADALLHVGQARAGRVLRAQQIRHQRMHAGRGEQNGRVVLRDDGRAGDDRVAMVFKEAQIHCAQFVSGLRFQNYHSFARMHYGITKGVLSIADSVFTEKGTHIFAAQGAAESNPPPA